MTRADLIAALEKAEGPSRELDYAIEEELGMPITYFGRTVEKWWRPPGAGDYWNCVTDDGVMHFEAKRTARFSASIDAALTLVPEGMVWTVFTCDPPETDALFGALVGQRPSYGPLSMKRYRGSAATPAIALCIAALKARE